MIDMQQSEVATAPVAVADNFTAGRRQIDVRAVPSQDCPVDSDSDEVVVCGQSGNEDFRLRPLPPLPPRDDFLSRPLRVQIAPGVSFGFQRGGGLGLKAEFGPGKKTGEMAKEPIRPALTAEESDRTTVSSPEPSDTP